MCVMVRVSAFIDPRLCILYLYRLFNCVASVLLVQVSDTSG